MPEHPRVEPARPSWDTMNEPDPDWALTPEECAELDRRLDDPDPGRPADEVFEEIRRELLARRNR